MTWKPFITRIATFLILLYAIIPFGIYKYGTQPQLTVNVLFVPIVFAGMITAFILLKKEELKNFQYETSWKQTILFGLLAYAFFAAYLVQQNQWWGKAYEYPHLLTGYALYLVGGLLLFLSVFNTSFARKFLKTIILSFITIIAYVLGSVSLNLAGYPLTRTLVVPLAGMLSLTNEVSVQVNNAPTLSVNSFTATIGPPCTGITSLILFTGLFLFVVILDWKKINKKSMLWIYPLGAIIMFMVAFLRLYALFYIGANYSSELAMKGFHANAGWILFVVYFFIYFWFTYPKMTVK